MITLAAKMQKVENIMNDGKMVAAMIPPYLDLRGFASAGDFSEALATSEAERAAFFKFCTSCAVGVVPDKAAEFEAAYQ